MRLIKLSVCTVLTFTAVGGAAQAQSIYGAGGLFLNPTANFAPKGSITPSFLTIGQDGPGALGGKGLATSYSISYSATNRFEAGGTYLKLSPGGALPGGSFGVFAKYRLVEGEVGGRPDIAVGGNNLTGGDLDSRTAFVAARYTPRTGFHDQHPVHLHAGVLYADKYWGVRRSTFVPYGGVDIGLTRNLSAFAEMRGRMGAEVSALADVKAPAAIGLVWRPAGSYTIAIAYGKNGQSRENKLGIGVGFTLGSQGGSGERRSETQTSELLAQSQRTNQPGM